MLRPILAAVLFASSAFGLSADKPGPSYPPLPKAISSFGGVECDGFIYVYGGHAGKSHTYSTESNLGTFHRLPSGGGTKWEELPAGPALQGLNLAATGGKVYRVGGMEARNKPGDKQDLHSLSDVAVFDPKAKTWSTSVPMPAGRSSHDVVAVGSKLVVVGGWQMKGAEKTIWYDTALVLDTGANTPKWESILQPFKRRAFTAAALGNKVYVIGGLTEKGEMVRKVDVLDVASGKWTEGPEFPGTERVGFSPAATVVGGKLVLNASDKNVHVLNEKGTAWDKIGSTADSRYVHRLVPGGKDTVVVIAGGSPQGPYETVEVVKLGEAKSVAAAPADPKAQKFCPVMTTDEIDPSASATVEYKGVKIYLCCDACVSEIQARPVRLPRPEVNPRPRGVGIAKAGHRANVLPGLEGPQGVVQRPVHDVQGREDLLL